MKPLQRNHTITTFAIFAFLGLNIVSYSFAAEEVEVELRVARVSYIEGSAAMLRTNDEDWTDVTINTPLMAGDKLYTNTDGRLEIQLEDDTVIRLSGDAFVEIPILDDALTRFVVVKGTVVINALNIDETRPPIEIETQAVTAGITNRANVRFNVVENGGTEVVIRRGEIQVYQGQDQFYRLKTGDRLIAETPDPTTHRIDNAAPEDTFDRWCDLRDARRATHTSTQYVTTRISGYRDLDEYGTWVETKEYGRVWNPTVNVTVTNWAPYRDGRWIWRPPYGWTWVSYEPWGWAPYHYGRWFYHPRHHWCWIPTDVAYMTYHSRNRHFGFGWHRPVWHPALVSFTYAKHGKYFHFSLGGGHYDQPCVGWFPLGPRDPYHRWYHPRSIYVDRRTHRPHPGDRPQHGDTFITNNYITDNSTHIYQNQYVSNAVTVVPQKDFHDGGQPRNMGATLEKNRIDHINVGAKAFPELPPRRVVTTKNRRDTDRTMTTANPQVKTGGGGVNATMENARRTAAKTARTRPVNNQGFSPTRTQTREVAAPQRTNARTRLGNRTNPQTAPATKQNRTAIQRETTRTKTTTPPRANEPRTTNKRTTPSAANSTSIKRETTRAQTTTPARVSAPRTATKRTTPATTNRTSIQRETTRTQTTTPARVSAPRTTTKRTAPATTNRTSIQRETTRTQTTTPARVSAPRTTTKRTAPATTNRTSIQRETTRSQTTTPARVSAPRTATKRTAPAAPSRTSIQRETTRSQTTTPSKVSASRNTTARISPASRSRASYRGSSSSYSSPTSSNRSTYQRSSSTYSQPRTSSQSSYRGSNSSYSQPRTTNRSSYQGSSSTYSQPRTSSQSSYQGRSSSYSQPRTTSRSSYRGSSSTYSQPRTSSRTYSSPSRSSAAQPRVSTSGSRSPQRSTSRRR